MPPSRGAGSALGGASRAGGADSVIAVARREMRVMPPSCHAPAAAGRALCAAPNLCPAGPSGDGGARPLERSEIGEATVVREHLDDGLVETEAALDDADEVLLVPEHERHRDAGLAGTRRATRSVQVRLLVFGRVVVDDHVDVVDVNAARCDVGGNENGELSTGEVGQSPLARALPEIAMDGPGARTLTAELSDEAVGAPLVTHHDYRALQATAYWGADLYLVHLVDVQEPVRHLVDRRFGRFNLVFDGIVHVSVDELSHAAVEGGREQHRLMLGLDAVQQLLHLGHEAEVGHPVGLVHDEDLDRAQRELASFEEVDETTRRADHGVDALSEGGDL